MKVYLQPAGLGGPSGTRRGREKPGKRAIKAYMHGQNFLHIRGGHSFFRFLTARPRKDAPANASDLQTPEEIEFEHRREGLRMVQEKRKSFGWMRKGFVAVLAILVAVAAGAASTLAVGLISGPFELVIPSVSILAGSGGAGVFCWRLYVELVADRPG